MSFFQRADFNFAERNVVNFKIKYFTSVNKKIEWRFIYKDFVRNLTPCTSLGERGGRRGGPGRWADSCSRPSESLSVPPGWPPRCGYAALRASCTTTWEIDHGLIKYQWRSVRDPDPHVFGSPGSGSGSFPFLKWCLQNRILTQNFTKN